MAKASDYLSLSGVGTCHREPCRPQAYMVLLRWIPSALKRRTDSQLFCRNLETIQKVGRNSHWCHSERQGSALFQRDWKYFRKLRLYLHAQSGKRWPADSRKGSFYLAASAFLRHQLFWGRRPVILRQCHHPIPGSLPTQYQAVSDHEYKTHRDSISTSLTYSFFYHSHL